jgi:hypothetical protein
MDGAPIDRVLAKLPGAKRSGRGWAAPCPAHDDTHPSLAIDIGRDGRVLLRCHAGCSLEAILDALGLTARDLFPPDRDAFRGEGGRPHSSNNRHPRRIQAVYGYGAADGTLRYQTVRLEPKGFYQRRPDGQGGWINDL